VERRQVDSLLRKIFLQSVSSTSVRETAPVDQKGDRPQRREKEKTDEELFCSQSAVAPRAAKGSDKETQHNPNEEIQPPVFLTL
jgi:hypothetical protein